MDCKIIDLIVKLRNLPPPRRVNQIHNIRILPEPPEYADQWAYRSTPPETTISVRAERFGKGSDTWLEWVIDVN